MILVCSCCLFRFVKFINVDWEWLELEETYVSHLSKVVLTVSKVAGISHGTVVCKKVLTNGSLEFLHLRDSRNLWNGLIWRNVRSRN